MKLQVIVNEELLKSIDDRCASQGYDRSEFIRECIRGVLYGPRIKDIQPGKNERLVSGFKMSGISKKEIKTAQDALKTVSENFDGLCPHGSMIGLCKKGCK